MDLWWIILEELKVLGEDHRMEVRHSALHSLHVALSTHGNVLTAVAWQRVMQDIIIALLERISLNYFKNSDNSERKSPKIENSGETIKRQSSLIVYGDSNEKQWEETYNIFTQNLGKIFRTYLNNLERQEEEILETPSVKKNWDMLINKLKEGIASGTVNIITAVLKTIKELLSCPRVSTLFFTKWSSSWELIIALSIRLNTSNITVNFKLITIILEVLTLIFSTQFENQFEEPCLKDTYSVISSLLKFTSVDTPLLNAKLLPEQRDIWDFIEKLMITLAQNERDLNSFISFLLKYIKYNPEDPHSDSYCRRCLEVIEVLVQQYSVQASLEIPEILGQYSKLLMLRFTNEGYQQTFNSSKGAQPLWYFAGESFLKILPELSQEPYWEKVILIFQLMLNVSDKTIVKISKPNLEAMSKTAEDLDIKCIETLASMLLNGGIKDDAVSVQLINIIDNGCDSFYKALHAQELVLRKSFTSSCFNSLLALSQEKSQCSSISCLILVSRCRDLLMKFSKEEKLSGQMPLPRVKLLEMLEILNELKKLEIAPRALSKPGKKAHLFEIFPQLCELITVKDSEIKEALKLVFLEISKNM